MKQKEVFGTYEYKLRPEYEAWLAKCRKKQGKDKRPVFVVKGNNDSAKQD